LDCHGEVLEYDSAAGYCIGSDGTPGGEVGEKIRNNLEEKITD
jgi:hypothetical protein